MHIITDIMEARAFAKNMAQSLADLVYWRNWYALDISSKPEMDWIKQAKVTTLLRSKMPEGDGSILWLEGGILVVFQSEEALDPASLKETLEKAVGLQALQITVLSIVGDNDKVKELLVRRQGSSGLVKEAPPASYKFLKSLVPDIEGLLRNWHNEKKVREGREKPVIMIVDDDPMTVKLVSRALSREYEVVMAESGAEAIAKHLQQMPDIIFLDIGLPDCDGLTLLNYMQQYDQECRIVMFSADDFLKTRVRAFAGGAKGYLPKPFNLQAFQRQIAEWFSTEKRGES